MADDVQNCVDVVVEAENMNIAKKNDMSGGV